MARESFSYLASESLFKKLEAVSQRSGVSRGQAFEDWLTAMVCALAAETKEEEYLTMVERHKDGQPGKRGIDLMGQMMGELVQAMSEQERDILGDMFQGCITYGERGQFFTPESIAELLANLTAGHSEENDEPTTINDPCCGSGRMLLRAAKHHPNAELVGQDVDPRCARMAALNFGFRSMYGYVVCQNTLTLEAQFAYRIAPFFHDGPNGRRRGVIRDIPLEQAPVSILVRDKQQKLVPLDRQPKETNTDNTTLPSIIEIPRWVQRMEHALLSQHEAENVQPQVPSSAREPRAETYPSSENDDDRGGQQGTLF